MRARMISAGTPASFGTSRQNNFDALRIIAAVMVLVSHSYALKQVPQPSYGNVPYGTVAVIIFFGISGYLVTESWRRDPHLIHFAIKRVLRLFPALIVVLLLTVFVLGPLVTTVSPSDYFVSFQTWGYVARNLFMWQMTYNLPGVFLDLPIAQINGSIWTLPSELHAYVLVAVIGLVGLWHTRGRATLAIVVILLVCWFAPRAMNPWGNADLLTSFFVGAGLLLWRDRVVWSWPLAIAGFLLCLWMAHVYDFIQSSTGSDYLIAKAHLIPYVVIPYLVLMVAYGLPAVGHRLLHDRDLSYGTYVYAFPVQQTVIHLWPSVTPREVIAVALPITLVFAAASWFLIERPALRAKPKVLAWQRDFVASRRAQKGLPAR